MKRKAVSGIMLTLILISMLTLAFNIQLVRAEPTTWTVDDDGGADFTSIQDAIIAASPGDTIFVYNGTYYEHPQVYKNDLTIVGEHKNNTIIDGSGSGAVLRVYAENVAVRGFRVQNSGWGWYYHQGSGIYLDNGYWNGRSCNISDNIISNCRYGISLWNSIYNTIKGNTISNTHQGISFDASRDNTVVGNTISNGVQVGSYLPCGISFWWSNDNTIVGNVVTNISYVGINLDGGRNNVISGNTISDIYGHEWPRGINLYASYNNIVSGNTISNIGDINEWPRGIQLDTSYNNIVSGNVISDIDEIAIGLWGSYNNPIIDNSISESVVGVYLENDSYNNTIISNTMHACECGINVWGYNNRVNGNTMANIGYVGIQLNSFSEHPNECTNNVVSENDISNSTFGINLIMASFANTVAGNDVSDNGLGILLGDSDNNTILENYVSNNDYGILLFSSNDTKVYHNNFIDNTQQVLLSQSFNTAWDDDYPSGGNYWSDYTGVDLYNGPYQNETGSDGIGDTPHVIDDFNQDNYPFMNPWFLDTTPPVADAGPDQTVYEDTPVTFNGGASSDNVGIVSYVWTFVDVTPQTLTGITPNYTFTDPGIYLVTLNVSDSAGNYATDTVTITVLILTPEVLIQRLNETIETWNLPKGTENSLISKLEGALHLLDIGNENGAIHKLMDFINQVEALRDKGKLENWQADYLISKAQKIIDLINE